jgi:hypothetical protein
MKKLALFFVFTMSVSAFANSQYSQCTLRIQDNNTRIDLLENSHINVKFNLDEGKSLEQEINLKRVIVFENKSKNKTKSKLEKRKDVIVMFDTEQTTQLVKKVTTEYDKDLVGKSLMLSNNLTIKATRSLRNKRKVEIKIRNSAARKTYTMRLSGIGAEVHGSIKVPFSYTGTKGILWAKKSAQKNKLQKIQFNCQIVDAPADGMDEIKVSNDSDDVKAEKKLLKEMKTVISE